jgi:leucyl aminopeptidase
MPPTTTDVRVLDRRLADLDADLVIVPVFEQDDLDDLPGLDDPTRGDVARARGTREFTGKIYDFFVTPITADGWKARRLALAGAGARSTFSTDRLRKLASASGLMARRRRAQSLAFVTRAGFGPAEVQAIAEGLVLAAFDGDVYKTEGRDEAKPPALSIAVEQPSAVEAVVRRGAVLGDCSNIARALANEPPNVLTPRSLAERAASIAGEAGVSVEVLDEHRLAELKMGLILGVGQGSAEPPRLIVLRHVPHGAPDAPTLGLVGKAVTFDTGGISIKPADGMDRMKDDMAGGAAVICAMRAIAMLGAPMRVVGVVPAAENMPGGRAYRPADILTSASGKTVEVVNTDAEGRLLLGDALWHAGEIGATHLVDVATLTGACVVALGRITSGLYGTPDAWRDLVHRTADAAGDRSWPLPLFDEYKEQLRSEIADIINSGGRPAGSITAAMFLREFTRQLPWAHLDIAGTAWADESKPFQPKGPVGIAVRTLAELAFTSDREAWRATRPEQDSGPA